MTKIQQTFIISIFLIIILACTKSPDDKLIGEWQGVDDDGVVASIVFEKNKTVKLIQGSLVLEGSYSVNKYKDYFELDIIVKQSSKTVTTPMILRFVTDDKIQIRMSKDNASRPIGFSSTKDSMQIVLKRQ
jgi:hypothetical protein